jgi:hypothetical protein
VDDADPDRLALDHQSERFVSGVGRRPRRRIMAADQRRAGRGGDGWMLPDGTDRVVARHDRRRARALVAAPFGGGDAAPVFPDCPTDG